MDIPQLLSRQVRVLRAQIGPEVEPREAYVDQVLLNVYGGPGQTAVLIDDLDVVGLVPRGGECRRIGGRPGRKSNCGGFQCARLELQLGRRRARQVSINGSLLLVDGKPMLPRDYSVAG